MSNIKKFYKDKKPLIEIISFEGIIATLFLQIDKDSEALKMVQ